jgi:hypothetical protein
MELLRSCPDFNVKGEIFHPTTIGHYWSETDVMRLKIASNGKITSEKDVCEWRARHPRQTLDVLFENGSRLPLAFKLFNGHLSKEQIATEIFRRDDVGYIILRRRPIESFISRIKAQTLGAHQDIDTTSTKPALHIAPFVKWGRNTRSWYHWLESEMAARKLPCGRLGYEVDIEGKSGRETLSRILTTLQTMGLPPCALPLQICGAIRQERESEYTNRVANWSQFEAEAMARPDYARLLHWAKTAR